MGVQTPWLKRDEAAEYARVKPTTIDRWAKKGWIKKHKIGSIQSVRYHAQELDKFLSGQHASAGPWCTECGFGHSPTDGHTT